MELLLAPLLGGIGIALISGPLGCFLVWRRLAYFGDTLSHSTLLGVALAYALNININTTVIVTCLAIALLLVALQQQRYLSSDTLLGILAHSSLALGLLIISLLNDSRLNLSAFLFGDLLTLSDADIVSIYLISALVLSVLFFLWRPLLAISLDEELAQVEGIQVFRIKLTLMALIALVIATTIKLVGALLITALMIIPAASARRWARSPEGMAIRASLLGMLAIAGGLLLAYGFDSALGPSIVVCCTVIFLLGLYLPKTSD